MVAAPIAAPGSAEEAAPYATPDTHRAVRGWLLVLILLVFAMVLVGGTTRLTESGLSITEWDLVTGTMPPTSDAAWQAEFERYQKTPQYALLNEGMSLSAFKTIYWWEWGHRELGRFIGLVYIGGFLWFAARRVIRGKTLAILAAMGVLLGTQGAVGWIMVASGLQPGMTAVAPVKLALHMLLACLFFASLVVMYVRLGGAARETAPGALRFAAWLLVVLTFVQIGLGSLVAGHDAGLTYNTWPLMDGRFVPNGLGMLEPAWLNMFDNITTIQFNHRIGAYVLAAMAFAYALVSRRGSRRALSRGMLIAGLVLLQVMLGILTLIHVVPITLGVAHQGLALLVLAALVWNASVFRRAA